MEKEFERAIAAGKINAATKKLIENWCAHVEIKKMGGTGLIEIQTGYPIGHHSLQCDFAPQGGMACWDLRDSALDFYDRNCIACEKRKPVGLPNISKLVSERDIARQKKSKAIAEEEKVQKKQAEMRRNHRLQLREGLTAVATSILEDIQTFDDNRIKENSERLKESGRLAPEHFPEKLISYLFEFTEKESWFSETGLAILYAINADKIRLTKLASRLINTSDIYNIASTILIAHANSIEPNDVSRILRSAIEKANPINDSFIDQSIQEPKPELLYLLWKKFNAEVIKEVKQLLSNSKYRLVELAGRGLVALQATNPLAAKENIRLMISVYVRAHTLIEDMDERHELQHVNDAIRNAFEQEPLIVDEIIQQLLASSNKSSKIRAYKIYENVLKFHKKNQTESVLPIKDQPQRIALQRILWAPTLETDHEILTLILGVFRSAPYELEQMARAEIDSFLAALLILDDKLHAIDAEPQLKNEDFLTSMERSNRRSAIKSLMKNYIEWASIVSADDENLITKIIDLIDTLPEGRDELKGILLGSTEHLASSVKGLTRILPNLYHGLVGASTLNRYYAANALAEINYKAHANIPPLIYEAFCVLFSDPYVIVHKQAVRSLRRFNLPEKYRKNAAFGVLNIFLHYRTQIEEDDFLVECIKCLVDFIDEFSEQADNILGLLIETAIKVDPIYLKSDLRFLSHRLINCDVFADLIIHMLPNYDHEFSRDDETWRLLQQIPDISIIKRQSQFVKLGTQCITNNLWITYEIIERLSQCGADDAAHKLTKICSDSFPDNPHNRAIRIKNKFLTIAHEFEAAVRSNNKAILKELSEQWTKNNFEQEEQKKDAIKRSSRAGLPFSD